MLMVYSAVRGKSAWCEPCYCTYSKDVQQQGLQCMP